MPLDLQTFLSYIVANLFQGMIAMIWILGLNRFAGPFSSIIMRRLLAAALILPVIVGLLRLLGLPGLPTQWHLARIDLWTASFVQWNPFFRIIAFIFIFGTLIIFILQELIPSLKNRTQIVGVKCDPTSRVVPIFAKVKMALVEGRFLANWQARRVSLECIESAEPVAILKGFFSPTLVFSDGLIDRLDDEELEGVVAHELAHVVYGGNWSMLGIWLVRLVQALSPAALVLFRDLVETREACCDVLASQITKKPLALASALLKVQAPAVSSSSNGQNRLLKAQDEVFRRGEIESTRIRVRRLIDESPSVLSRWAEWGVSVFLISCLGFLTWVIG